MCVCLALFILISSRTQAGDNKTIENPPDLTSQINSSKSVLNLSLGIGTVGDNVAYTPNLPEGGFRTPE